MRHARSDASSTRPHSISARDLSSVQRKVPLVSRGPGFALDMDSWRDETALNRMESNHGAIACAPPPQALKQPSRLYLNGAVLQRPRCQFDAQMEYEAPNPRIHFFTGTLVVGGTPGTAGAGGRDEEENIGAGGRVGVGAGGGGGREVPVDQSNLLLRGSRLRNTKWVLGIVAYTGKESKIAQNARAPPSKQSNLDKVSLPGLPRLVPLGTCPSEELPRGGSGRGRCLRPGYWTRFEGARGVVAGRGWNAPPEWTWFRI